MMFKFLREKKPNLPASYFERLEKAHAEVKEEAVKIRGYYERNLIHQMEGMVPLQIEMALLQEMLAQNEKNYDHEAIRGHLRNIAAASVRFMAELT